MIFLFSNILIDIRQPVIIYFTISRARVINKRRAKMVLGSVSWNERGGGGRRSLIRNRSKITINRRAISGTRNLFSLRDILFIKIFDIKC